MLSAAAPPSAASASLAPRVAAVYVANSGWSGAFKSQLAASGRGSAAYGYAIPTGTDQSRPLAWSGLNRVSIQFDQPVSVVKDDLLIRGLRVPQYAVDTAGFTYDAATRTATWTLAGGQTFANDQLVLDLDADGFQTLYDSNGFEFPFFTPSNLEGGQAPLSGQGSWQRTGNPGVGVVQNTLSKPGGSQAVSITRTGSDERWAVLQAVNNPTSTIRVQWDQYAKQTVHTFPDSYGPFFGVEAYDGIGNAPRLAGSAGIDAATGEVLYQLPGSGAIAAVPNLTLAFNAWHHFDLYLDYATHKYSVYVNDAKVVDNVGFVDHGGATPINDFSDAPIAALAAAGDPESFGASGQAYFDNYKIGLAPRPVANANNLRLDGDWVNGVSEFASGDGSAGGDFRFTASVLTADANGDGRVSFPDLLALAKNYGKPGTVEQGDFSGDGAVNFADLLTLAKNYNAVLTGTSFAAVPGAAAAASSTPWLPSSRTASAVRQPSTAATLFNADPRIAPAKPAAAAAVKVAAKAATKPRH